jgi:hypothetical protein
MRVRLQWAVSVAAVALLSATVGTLAQIRYSSGQNVAPIFEGWQKNADGTISMVFGYLNRNFEEQLEAPIGSDNRCEPAPVDCGQPTHFLTRRQRFVFKVTVPRDWPKDRKFTWTVGSHGKSDSANGWLVPEMEIDNGTISENAGIGILTEGNEPPKILTISPLQTVTLPGTATLTVSATDDGVPKPRPQPARAAAGVPPTPAAAPPSPEALEALARRQPGVRIRWVHYRGAGIVTFDPPSAPAVYGKPAEMTTKVTFSAPGTYVLRAIASDSQLEATADATVTVRAVGSR